MLDANYDNKVADFGLATSKGGNEDTEISFLKTKVGTKGYMAPELFL